MPPKAMSNARFEALTYAVSPIVRAFTTEREWYSDEKETVLGTLIFDHADSDWNWIILGRDNDGLFKAIDNKVSIECQEDARLTLQQAMEEVIATGQHVFPQDPKGKKAQLLTPVVPPEKLHPHFKKLIELDGYSPAREIMQEIAYAFVDIDGNYVKDFQTTNFSARLWELYLFAFLHEQRFLLNREFNRPDFCCMKLLKQPDGSPIPFPLNIEACTVNKTEGDTTKPPTTPEEAVQQEMNYMPIKYGSVLYSKMKKRYWELPHIKGLPFTLAIHDFHAGDSMVWSAQALDDYLYGLKASHHNDPDGTLNVTHTPIKEHIWGSKRIPSGFFNQPDTENISAVLFSNSATIAKFNRMGKLAGFGDPRIRMIREGNLHDFNPNATAPIPFRVEVMPGMYNETWSDSIRVFFNPKALNPFPADLLPGCSYHTLSEGRRIAVLPNGFIHNSRTIILQPKK